MWSDHGTWNDIDPSGKNYDKHIGAFITEWGKIGAEYYVKIADKGTGLNKNGVENGKNN